MKKIILSIIGLSTLVTIPVSSRFTNINIANTNKSIVNFEQNIAKNDETIAELNVDYDYKTGLRYNPTYPTFTINQNYYAKDRRTYVRKDKRNNSEWPLYNYNSSLDYQYSIQEYTWHGQEWQAASINALDYAPTKSEFEKNYLLNPINFSFYYTTNFYSGGWVKSCGTSCVTSTNKTVNYKVSGLTGSTQLIYDSYGNKEIKGTLRHSWSGNNLYFYVKTEAKNQWTAGSSVGHASIVSVDSRTIKFNSSFNQNSLKNKVNGALSTSFTINSDTSPNISSTEQNGKPGNLTKSNKELIEDEINKRLKTSFGVDYDAWFGGTNSILKINTTYDDNNSIASITLKDESKISGNEQFVTNVKMPIKLKLTDYYFQKEAQKRLQIVPGQIVNPNSIKNQLIKDNPEYDPKTNTFTYHNSVDVTFTGINGKEIMYVNGQEVPVYENIYRARLNDNRDNDGKGNNSYSITVKGVTDPNSENETELKLNVKIEALSNDLNYRWLGWNPELYPEQKKLISKNNDDGTINLDYDPTINPETGMRNQYIFVSNQNNKYPFFIDPLDRYGNLIKEDDPDKDEKSYNGYIAEAYVANSGIALLNEFDMKNIAKIERVKLDPITFEQIGTIESIKPNLNEQWSYQGLWHYIVYLKDYVDQEIDPSNPGTNEIKAKSGSTLHKLIYISKDLEDYTSFLNLNEIQKNENILEFWSSIPGRHLKNYLIQYTQINTSSKIEELSYEQLILYWKQYVSDQMQQKVDVPTEPVNYKDLNKLEISTLKMNEINPVIVQEKIIDHVTKAMSVFSKKAIYGVDYNIYSDNNIVLKDTDFSDFTNIEQTSKKMNLVIKASPISTLLTNKQTFKIMNNKDYDETKALDLSTINLKPIEYNFSAAPIEVKEEFVENYIFNYVNQIFETYRPLETDWDYIYGEDYYISINGLYGQDITIQENFNDFINRFLNSKEKISLELTIISIDESIKLSNYTSYQIINNPDSDEVAPPNPPTPGKPDPTDPTLPGEIDSFNSLNLLWIIPLTILILTTFGLIIYWIFKRTKPKKIK